MLSPEGLRLRKLGRNPCGLQALGGLKHNPFGRHISQGRQLYGGLV